MKTTLKLITLSAVIALFGCKDKLTNIDIDQNKSTAEFTIVSGAPAGVYNDSVIFNSDFEKIAKDNGVKTENFKSLKLKEAKAIITNGKTFDPLSKITIILEATGLPTKTILVKDPVNGAGLSTINFDVDQSVDLLPYFKTNNITIRSNSVLSSSVVDEIKMKLELKYTVNAGL